MADIIQAIIDGGRKFFITTEKKVRLKDGSPAISSTVTKISQYAIQVREGVCLNLWALNTVVSETTPQ